MAFENPGYVALDKAGPRPVDDGVLSHSFMPQFAANVFQIEENLGPWTWRPTGSTGGLHNNGVYFETAQWEGFDLTDPLKDSLGWVQHGQVVFWAAAAQYTNMLGDISLKLPTTPRLAPSLGLPICVGSVYMQAGSAYWAGTAIYDPDWGDGGEVRFYDETGARMSVPYLGGTSGTIGVNGFYRCLPPADSRRLNEIGPN